MTCKNITPKKKNLCIGALQDEISILTKTINPRPFTNPEYTTELTLKKVVFSAIETVIGWQSFDNLGDQTRVTHKFFILFDPDLNVTSEDVIEFKVDRYKIEFVTNIDEDDNFVLIECIKTGEFT